MKPDYNIIIASLKEFDPISIGIFDSYARSEQNQNSDIDILVKFKKSITLMQLIRLENELTEKLGIKVDLVTEGALTNAKLIKEIFKDLNIIFANERG